MSNELHDVGGNERSPAPLSVLVFHPADGFAGAERTTTNIVRLSDRSKLRFVVVSGPNAFRPEPGEHFVSLFDLGLNNGFGDLRRSIADARALCRLAERENCRVALGMLHYGAFVVALMRFLSLFRIKAIASPRTPSVRGIAFHVGRTGPLAFKWRNLVRFFCRFADRVIVASEGLKSECVHVYGSRPDRVVVIPNGIDSEKLRQSSDAHPALNREHSGFRIVTTGRLAPEKDLDTLLVALASVRESLDATLSIVGEGPELERLRQRAEALGIAGAVEFLGFRPDPFSIVKSADVFVHTALFEGFGNVLLEAMACGVPVIATDCDFGPREIIQHGVSGLLVPASEPIPLAEAILALHRDSGLRQRLIANGYTRLQRYSIGEMVRAYEQAILTV